MWGPRAQAAGPAARRTGARPVGPSLAFLQQVGAAGPGAGRAARRDLGLKLARQGSRQNGPFLSSRGVWRGSVDRPGEAREQPEWKQEAGGYVGFVCLINI